MIKVGDDILNSAVQILRASYAALPTEADMTNLISDSRAAEDRGYYDPLEDERLREAYSRYLGCLLYTSPSPRDLSTSRMPSSA